MSADINPTAAELIAFLHGSAPLGGFYFGEKPANERGYFWWRKYLHVLEAAPASSASAQAVDATKPIAWVRFRSDGCYEGPIMDGSRDMCDIRRRSGAWTPLYALQSQQSPVQASDAGRQG